jgi:hypothetical protein
MGRFGLSAMNSRMNMAKISYFKSTTRSPSICHSRLDDASPPHGQGHATKDINVTASGSAQFGAFKRTGGN